jgi:hypothetical protein
VSQRVCAQKHPRQYGEINHVVVFDAAELDPKSASWDVGVLGKGALAACRVGPHLVS